MKAPHLCHDGGRWPALYGVHLGFIYLNSLRGHDIAKKPYSFGAKVHFSRLSNKHAANNA